MMNRWIFICLIIIIIAIANPFLMDYIAHVTSDVYVNQLKVKDNANPLEVKNSSKVVGLVYLAEAIIIFVLILFMRKSKNAKGV